MSANLVPFSSAGGFVTAGNITAAIAASPAPSINGFSSVNSVDFNATGNISLDGGAITGGIATVVTDGINSILSAPGATMDVYGFPFAAGTARGQLTISGITTPNEANGTWYYQSINTYTYQLYTDSTYSTLVDASGWSAYTGGGSVAITLQDPRANIVINSNGYLSTFDNTGAVTLPGDFTTAGSMYVGPTTSANSTTFPGALAVFSSTAANIQVSEPGPTGLIAEATGNPADTANRAVGIYGVGYTSGGTGADGVSGEAHVSDTTDTGTATAVRGYADNTHDGLNIGLYSSAIGGTANYALYMKHGNILSFDPQVWTVTGNSTSALEISSAIKANILNVVTTTGAEGVNMSGFANVTGNVSSGNLRTTGTISATGNILTNAQIQSTAFTGGNISWSANNQTDFQGAIRVGGTGRILSPGGAASITLNNNGANIPTLGVTIGTNATSTTTGALIVTGGAGLTGNIYVGGNIVGNTAGYTIGYRDIPQVSFAGDATIATTDAGKHYYSTLSTGNVLTIANNASQGFQVGAAITIVNQGSGTITVAQGSGVTLYLAGNATAGNRTVATFGMATIMKVATDTWFINGTGVS